MVKFNQDHLEVILSIFHFLATLSYPPPSSNLIWVGWQTQYRNFQNFLKWPKILSRVRRKTSRLLGYSLLVLHSCEWHVDAAVLSRCGAPHNAHTDHEGWICQSIPSWKLSHQQNSSNCFRVRNISNHSPRSCSLSSRRDANCQYYGTTLEAASVCVAWLHQAAAIYLACIHSGFICIHQWPL